MAEVGTGLLQCRAWCILLGWAAVAFPMRAATSVDVEIGWNGRSRNGAWTPVFITVSDPKPRNAAAQLSLPHDSTMGMAIEQPIAIGPSPQTFVIYAPLIDTWGESTTLKIRDRTTGKVLSELTLLDRNGEDG